MYCGLPRRRDITPEFVISMNDIGDLLSGFVGEMSSRFAPGYGINTPEL
jgi:hypothetical protein